MLSNKSALHRQFTHSHKMSSSPSHSNVTNGRDGGAGGAGGGGGGVGL